MDSENIGREAIIRVTNWLRAIWEMKRNNGPVQQWVDSIPSPIKTSNLNVKINTELINSFDECTSTASNEHCKILSSIKESDMTISTSLSAPSSPAITMTSIPCSPQQHSRLARDLSLQSDSSHCSSVESLLELRRADPEAILFGLGFGGCSGTSKDNGATGRIPKRFLQPSKLKGINIDDFVKQQQETNESLDSTSLGYRGLTGSPYVAPSEIVQKIVERLREHENHDSDNSESNISIYENRLSVLSRDNKKFLEQQRPKSPDMRNKRMIIGQKSFAFSCDGDLIELNDEIKNSSNCSTDFESDLSSILEHVHQNSNEDLCDDQNGIVSEESKRKTCSDDSNSSISLLEAKPNSLDVKITKDLERNKPTKPFRISKKTLERCRSQEEDEEDMKYDFTSSFKRINDVDDFSSLIDSPRNVIYDETRRFSEGTIKTNINRSSDKRRSLRRQARISDTEALVYCDNDIFNQHQFKKNIEFPQVNNLEDATSNNKNLDQVHEEEDHDNESCHHGNSTNCWRKMRKIMKKNKKLENMVVKSRQETAEIRDMLSNVLSIRLEPGF